MKRAKILSASAGSGKTYQLTLKYMCDVIQHPERYRNILAVTFTNKATEEMKSRILREIHRLAAGEHSQYIEDIKREIGLGEKQIRGRIALEAAEAHGNTQRAAVEELKLEALADVLARFHARKEG